METSFDLWAHLGLKLFGHGAQRRCRCPLHDDRHPSMSVNVEKGVWFCHAGCGHGHIGDLAQRLGVVLPGRQAGRNYQRVTSRCGGSKIDLLAQLRYGETLGHLSLADAARVMVDRFDISRATAYRRLAWLRGQARVVVQHGKRLGVRTAWALKRLRELAAKRLLKRTSRASHHEKLRQSSQQGAEDGLVRQLRARYVSLRRAHGHRLDDGYLAWDVKTLKHRIACEELPPPQEWLARCAQTTSTR